MGKLTKKDLQFRNKESETLFKPTSLINGNSFVIRNLDKCLVYLPSHTSTIYLDDCTDSQIFLGPTESSVFIRDCKNCQIATAAQQVRISDSSDLKVFVFSSTDLTLENARRIGLAPYNFVYPGVGQHFKDVMIDTSTNQGFQVMDFDREYGESDSSEENYYLIKAKNFDGFRRFHDLNMLAQFPDLEALQGLNLEDLEYKVEFEIENFPIDWPEIYGGRGQDPTRLNSQIQFLESNAMPENNDFIPSAMRKQKGHDLAFRMDASPILTNRKFFQKQSTMGKKKKAALTGDSEGVTHEVEVFTEVGNSQEQEMETSDAASNVIIKLKPFSKKPRSVTNLGIKSELEPEAKIMRQPQSPGFGTKNPDFAKEQEYSSDNLAPFASDYNDIENDINSLSRLDSEQSISKQFQLQPQMKDMLESEAESDREIDVKYIRSKLSVNQLKAIREIDPAHANFLIKNLYKRSLSRVQSCKARGENNKQLKRDRVMKGKEFIKKARRERGEMILENEGELEGGKKGNGTGGFEGNVWEGVLEVLEEKGQEKGFLKRRSVFRRAIKSKMENF